MYQPVGEGRGLYGRRCGGVLEPSVPQEVRGLAQGRVGKDQPAVAGLHHHVVGEAGHPDGPRAV